MRFSTSVLLLPSTLNFNCNYTHTYMCMFFVFRQHKTKVGLLLFHPPAPNSQCVKGCKTQHSHSSRLRQRVLYPPHPPHPFSSLFFNSLARSFLSRHIASLFFLSFLPTPFFVGLVVFGCPILTIPTSLQLFVEPLYLGF